MIQRLLAEIRALLFDDEQSDGPSVSRGRRLMRFWVMVGQGFARNRCPVRATALAYSSLLAFIPLLAVVIGVSTSVLKNDAARIQAWITELVFRVAPQLQNSEEFGLKLDTLVGEINRMISNVHSGAVGTTGVLALLVMILFMLARVEETLNDIWGVTRGRSWYSRLVNYWAAISLGPIVVFAAIGFSATINVPRLEVTFAPGDLKDLPALVASLKGGTNEVAKYVAGRLPEPARKAVEEYAGPRSNSEPLRRALSDGLNVLLNGPSIFDEARFAGVRLRKETRALLQSAPEGEALRRLNRSLLEDGLEGQVVRRPIWLSRYLGGTLGKLLVGLLQVPILAAACALFYAFMPNAKVQWGAALFGGGVAGVLWYLNNTLSTKFVSQLARNEAIFGSLAVIPVLMVGLYFFWMLLLFGAQVAYTHQNRRTLLAFRQTDRVHQGGRELVALRIMLEAARAFREGLPAPTPAMLSERLEVPSEMIARLTRVLLQSRLLVEVGPSETAFLPARPLEAITVADVLEAMRRGVGRGLPTRPGPDREAVERQLGQVLGAEKEAGKRTLAELVAAGREAREAKVRQPA